MPRKDSDLFDRLRQAGLRKQVAKTLSGIGEDASNKAVRAARSAVSELRLLADELERRLPKAAPDASATQITVGPSSAAVAAPRRSRRGASARTGADAGAGRARRGSERGVIQRVGATAPRDGSATAGASGARAPRGQNKARILASLQAGPKTASEIAKETGIGTGTVSTTLTKLAKSGELVKADRGYTLPA